MNDWIRLCSVLLGSCAILGGGCATIATGGAKQSISIESEPAGADCTLTRGSEELGKVKTPGAITIGRSPSDAEVACVKEGYHEGRVQMSSRPEPGSAFGNFILGGAIGVLVDMETGADHRYASSVMVWLAPLSPAEQVAESEAKAAAKSEAKASDPLPVAASPPPPGPPGPYDGNYGGTVELKRGDFRHIDVLVVSGHGTGTASFVYCPAPGEVELSIAPSGKISGTADLPSGPSCQALKQSVAGHVEGGRLLITLQQSTREFSLAQH